MSWSDHKGQGKNVLVEDITKKTLKECLDLMERNFKLIQIMDPIQNSVAFTALVTCQLLYTVMKSDEYQANDEKFRVLINQMVKEVLYATRKGR